MPREYAMLRERLMIAGGGKALKTLVFVGCRSGEGATQVVREFAEVLASSGLNVLLVDADMRSPGLTSALRPDGQDLSALVHAGESLGGTPWGRGRLTVVPSPGDHPDKEQFFRSTEFASWLDVQRSQYDYVLLDAPPLLQYADATLMGRLCDAVVLVAQAELTETKALAAAREQLARGGVNVAGVILNRMRNPVPGFLRRFIAIE